MPYIDRTARYQIDTDQRAAGSAGELNYAITVLIRRYTEGKGLSYQTANDVVGALEGAKAEYQRRIVAPYEDGKMAVNGDVYAVLSHDACGTDDCCGQCDCRPVPPCESVEA